jgi:hypothetical protein
MFVAPVWEMGQDDLMIQGFKGSKVQGKMPSPEPLNA